MLKGTFRLSIAVAVLAAIYGFYWYFIPTKFKVGSKRPKTEFG
jgi:hypothetical protein